MPIEPKRLVPPRPRADLTTTDLPRYTFTTLVFYRLTDVKYPSPFFWSKSGRYRFDSPSAKWGVCYAAETIDSAFQEVYSDLIRKEKINYTSLENYRVWRITVPATMRTIELAGPTLTRIRATVQSFVSRYSLSQEWGRALMLHKADLDGLVYIGRRCGKPCPALFGDSVVPKPYQSNVKVDPCGMLLEWKQFWRLMDQLEVKLTNLPAKRLKPTWQEESGFTG